MKTLFLTSEAELMQGDLSLCIDPSPLRKNPRRESCDLPTDQVVLYTVFIRLTALGAY